MKRTFSAPVSVPRLNSLRRRLEQTGAPDDETYLDQLMTFLDDPPPGITDRWQAGAEMCAAWGVTTTSASVWRLYRSHVIEWRLRIALGEELGNATPDELRVKIARLVALRTCELLTDPQTPPARALIKLARIELRNQALDLARLKHQDHERAVDHQNRMETEERAKTLVRSSQAADEFKAMLGLQSMASPTLPVRPKK